MMTLTAMAVGAAPSSATVQQAASTTAMPPLDAPTATMIDVSSGRVLFERDAHRRFIPASLTKIMTSYVAFELVAQGKLSLDRKLPVRHDTFKQWRGVGSTMFLADGAEVTVADLLRGIVTVSANDACVVLAEGVAGSVPAFTAMMNAEARKLGMRDTHYNTPNGWPDEGQTYVSAADLATLSQALILRHPQLYRRFYGHAKMDWDGIEQENHNPLYGYTAGADGVKTGFTNEAGYGFVGSAVRNGRRIIMVVGGYDTPALRAKQSRDFMEWGFSAWRNRPLYGPGALVGEARVHGGASRAVRLIAPRALAISVPAGQRAGYTLSIRYKGPLRAPIARGQEVATLIAKVPGLPDERLPLIAADAVDSGGPVARMRDGLLSLVGR